MASQKGGSLYMYVVSCTDQQAAFGKVVWTTLATQLESVMDTSTVTRTVTTLWGSLTFTVLYYILHKWIWRQLLWLTFGSIG